MAKCSHCGNIVPDGQQVCAVCGAPMNNGSQNYSNTAYANQNYQNQGYQNQNYQSYQNQNYQNQGYQNQGYQNQNYQNQGYQNQGYNNQNYSNQSLDGADTTYMYDPMDIQANKAMAVLSYIGIFCLIPLFANHTSRYARFHTVQGFTLFIISMAMTIINRVGSVVFGVISIGGVVWSTLFSLISLGLLVLAILGIVNAVQGKAKELPLIGRFHIIQLF